MLWASHKFHIELTKIISIRRDGLGTINVKVFSGMDRQLVNYTFF